jgi:phosphatidate cytidylyltransferase
MRTSASSRWKDLGRRAISAAVLAPIALGGIWLGGLAFTLLIGAGTVMLIAEWARLCRHAGAPWLLAAGTLWVLLAAAALLWLRADPATGRANLLFLMLLIWASDIGAYLVGRLVGGPLLAPRISPGKTWSGAAGGIVAALAVGWGAASLLPAGSGLARVAAVALVLCVIGQLGDLTESRAKRHFGVKDSGTLLPGHGGLLDRMDALIAVAPFAALLALCLGRGVLLWE